MTSVRQICLPAVGSSTPRHAQAPHACRLRVCTVLSCCQRVSCNMHSDWKHSGYRMMFISSCDHRVAGSLQAAFSGPKLVGRACRRRQQQRCSVTAGEHRTHTASKPGGKLPCCCANMCQEVLTTSMSLRRPCGCCRRAGPVGHPLRSGPGAGRQ